MKVMIVSPHPDDSEYGVGGIISCANDKANHNVVIYCNEAMDYNIDNLDLNQILKRKDEMLKAADFLNVECCFFSIRESLYLITDRIRYEKPSIILLPYLHDYNSVHRATTKIILDAIFDAQYDSCNNEGHKVSSVFYYETYSSNNYDPDYIIDVTQYYKNAKTALEIHKSGIEILPSIKYKFQLQHQIRGFEASCCYGEGLIRDKNYWFKWNQHIRESIDFIQSII